VTFELTILFGGVSAAIGMLALKRAAHAYHPVFNVPEFCQGFGQQVFPGRVFERSEYDAARTREFLKGLAPRAISEVRARS